MFDSGFDDMQGGWDQGFGMVPDQGFGGMPDPGFGGMPDPGFYGVPSPGNPAMMEQMAQQQMLMQQQMAMEQQMMAQQQAMTPRYYNQNAIYNQDAQLNFDIAKLTSLGFEPVEIEALQMVIATAGKVSPSILSQMGFNYEQSARLRYLYNMVTGRVEIVSTKDLSDHFRKMFGKHRKIGMPDLAISRISEVPRVAVVGGLVPPFDVFNSKNYPLAERTYKVTNVSGSRIFIKTNRRPVLKYKQSKKIDGMVEITEVANDHIIVAIDKKYAKLCNRFIVVGSTKRPETHHGLVEIICIEGTKIYVYAQSLGTADRINYREGTQRVYEYGFIASEIRPKLIAVAQEMYQRVIGVYAEEYPSNQDFQVLLPEEAQDVDEEEQSPESDFDEPT